MNDDLNFTPSIQFNNKSALVQIMAWPQTGEKSLSELMMT